MGGGGGWGMFSMRFDLNFSKKSTFRKLLHNFLSYKGKSERLYNHQLLGLLRRPRRRSDKIGKRLFRCRMIYIFQKGLVCPNRFSSSCLINLSRLPDSWLDSELIPIRKLTIYYDRRRVRYNPTLINSLYFRKFLTFGQKPKWVICTTPSQHPHNILQHPHNPLTTPSQHPHNTLTTTSQHP